MPQFDGPYLIINTHPEASTITLDMPNTPNLFPTFHISNVKPWYPNDNTKYPSCLLEQPGPIDVNRSEEFLFITILDHKKIGQGFRYLIHFMGYGAEHNRWIAGWELEDNEALNIYWKITPPSSHLLHSYFHTSLYFVILFFQSNSFLHVHINFPPLTFFFFIYFTLICTIPPFSCFFLSFIFIFIFFCLYFLFLYFILFYPLPFLSIFFLFFSFSFFSFSFTFLFHYFPLSFFFFIGRV